MYVIGDVLFDMREHRLFKGNREITLRPKSLTVLAYMVNHRGHVIPKAELIDAVWPNTYITENSLAQCLTEVRRALGNRSPSPIKTLSRRGFLLQIEDDPDAQASQGARSHPLHPLKELSDSATIKPGGAGAGLLRHIHESQLDLYLELCEVTATISSFGEMATERQAAERHFWVLFRGKMAVIADEVHIGPALMEFASALERSLPSAKLSELSLQLAQSCRRSLM